MRRPDQPDAAAARNRELLLLEIAGLRIGFASAVPFDDIGLSSAYRGFTTDGEPDVRVDLSFGQVPSPRLEDYEQVFDSGALWCYLRSDQEHLFVLRSPNAGPDPYRVARFDRDFSRGAIVSSPAGLAGRPGSLLPDPLEYPLGEVLTICLLNRRQGLMTHACGVDDRGRGYLFCGNSGDGKTTLARLWSGQGRVLNDDRIVLRRVDDRFRMEATPWHGDHREISAAPAPLDRIFVIGHAPENALKRLAPATAAQRLLTRCFPPFWSAAGMGRTLAAIDDIVASVPVFELGVVPDEAVVGLVRGLD